MIFRAPLCSNPLQEDIKRQPLSGDDRGNEREQVFTVFYLQAKNSLQCAALFESHWRFPKKPTPALIRQRFFNGGDEEDRTLDLTDANRTLSQLSYAPKTQPVWLQGKL